MMEAVIALNGYLTAVQNLLGTGAGGNLYPTATLTTYINDARQHVAEDAQCIRALPPISGPITAITVSSSGSGYGVSASVIISAPDYPPGSGPFPLGQQASATATVAGGITAVTLASTGVGYFSPVVSFSGAGHGAVAIAAVSGINQTVVGQEVYPFSGVNALVATSGSGISSIFMVNSIATLFGTWRYVYNRVSFSKYQAQVRQWQGFNYISYVFAQFGQGVAGTVYMYPVPNAQYQMEWDCCCLPNDLATDTDPEAIPAPYTDAIKYYATYLALMQSQRYADAAIMYNPSPQAPGKYQQALHRARAVSQPRSVTNWYGRS